MKNIGYGPDFKSQNCISVQEWVSSIFPSRNDFSDVTYLLTDVTALFMQNYVTIIVFCFLKEKHPESFQSLIGAQEKWNPSNKPKIRTFIWIIRTLSPVIEVHFVYPPLLKTHCSLKMLNKKKFQLKLKSNIKT